MEIAEAVAMMVERGQTLRPEGPAPWTLALLRLAEIIVDEGLDHSDEQMETILSIGALISSEQARLHGDPTVVAGSA